VPTIFWNRICLLLIQNQLKEELLEEGILMALDLKNQEMVLEIGSNLVGLTTQEMILEDLEDLLMHMQLISSVVEITIIPIIL